MKSQSLFGKLSNRYFSISGKATRLQYFTFLTYVAGTTTALVAFDQHLPQSLAGQQPALASVFLALHTIPLTAIFLRRVRDAGQALPMQMIGLAALLLAGFPVALTLGVGTVYALAALVLGQLLCIDQVRLKSEPEMDIIIVAVGTETDPDHRWHQMPLTAKRGVTEIYRVRGTV
jgi:uncharacterized membrane protein YhaH (DUF805 family)